KPPKWAFWTLLGGPKKPVLGGSINGVCEKKGGFETTPFYSINRAAPVRTGKCDILHANTQNLRVFGPKARSGSLKTPQKTPQKRPKIDPFCWTVWSKKRGKYDSTFRVFAKPQKTGFWPLFGPFLAL